MAIQRGHPSEPGRAVIATAPGGEVDNEKADWDFDDLLAGPLGGGRSRRSVLFSIYDLVSELVLSVP